MKRVVSAFSCASVLAMCVPSMFDTNHTRGPPFEYGFRASVTIRGPYEAKKTNIDKTVNVLGIKKYPAFP